MNRPKNRLLNWFAAAVLIAVVAACGGQPPVQVDRTLSVTVAGDGAGTVVSDPVGIDVTTGMDTAEFTSGTEVTLTATPVAGSTFVGWSGACTGDGACDVTLDANASVTATFALTVPDTATLTVSAVGDGDGSVMSAPAGIDLISGADTDTFDFVGGTEVTLTATPDVGSVFVGWSGACSGQDACVVTMNADTNVTADFQLEGSTSTTAFAIQTGDDDVEEYTLDVNASFPAGTLDTGSSDLDLTGDTATGDFGARGPVVVGLRYDGVALPKNALITSATITFTRSGTNLGSVTFDVVGDASDDAAPFVGGTTNPANFNVSTRPATTASVVWESTTAWTDVTAESANLATIVQELVNRDGWESGNALAFVITSDADAGNIRRAHTFETSAGTTAAQLSVTYYTPTAP